MVERYACVKLAASYGDTQLMAPDDAAASFFKSPFRAHETGSAVDIAYGDFGSPASSPVDGVIVDIREFETPTPFKDRNFKEYLTAVRCGELVVRILHVKPDLGIGDRVRTGEDFGTFIRSGYFYFWNFSHLHVEVRMPDDYLRATSNMPLDLPVGVVRRAFPGGADLDSDIFEFTGEVVLSNKRYALFDCPDYSTDGHFNGYSVGGFLLDGFIPACDHALHRFGLVGKCHDAPPFDCFKSIGNSHLVYSSSVNLIVFDRENRTLDVAGAAFILFFSKPLIKLVPTRYGKHLPQCGDVVSVQIDMCKD
ncbi:MAG: hypothetical protein C4B59_03670 [Candidatus Methanogaster sp.]|uniref:Uncharacterized protein n=1 Tax=Candidatus Methanogaster sp. TaxID=3386292 RepID=A0AC61L5R9_9EURY|nr:MAG: hypothetical protein C4B59_03670 [ANME-2 cluster archaeon]